MKFALVYISPNGTTKSTTEILEKIIKEDGDVYKRQVLNCSINFSI